MAKFYMMAKYTPEALKGFMSNPSDDRKEAVSKLVESIGGEVVSFDIVRGELDLVLCVDGTDFNSAAAAKIAVQSTGMVSDAIILEAVDMTEIVSKASTVLGSYSKPGG